jgi:hypothetical protein
MKMFFSKQNLKKSTPLLQPKSLFCACNGVGDTLIILPGHAPTISSTGNAIDFSPHPDCYTILAISQPHIRFY